MSKPSDTLLAWAAVGSRISGFHHDTASKLQSLMMALDEANEQVGDDRPELRKSLDTATAAMRELHQLLTENRALAKAPQTKAVSVADLMTRAAGRHGVKLVGELGAATVHVAPPSIVHALALLCDLLAGPLKGARTVDISVAATDDAVSIDLAGTPTAAALDAITIATFLVEREGGAVHSAPRGFQVQLPTRARSADVKP